MIRSNSSGRSGFSRTAAKSSIIGVGVARTKSRLNRWVGKANPPAPQGRDLAGLPEVRARWEEVEAERGAFLRGVTDATLGESRMVAPSSGGTYAHTFDQMFRHAIDHSSYHRGQVVTLLRQLGAVPPSTGLINYYREHPQ